MNRFYFLFTVLLLSITTILRGQFVKVERYNQEDGLPNDLIKSFAIDSSGFVWVATDDGMVKIEGRNFINVSTPPMFSNNFKNILQSKKYGVLASADAGVLKINQVFDGIDAQYFDMHIGLLNWPKLIYPKILYEALDSSIWIADLQMVCKIKDKQVSTYPFPQKCFTDHFSRSYQFLELNENHFFVLSQTGFLYELNKNYFIEIPWNYQGTKIFSVAKLDSNSFLIGCEVGLLKVTFDDNGFLKEVENLNFKQPVSVIKQLDKNKFILGTWRFGAYYLTVENEKCKFNFIEDSEQQAINDIIVDKQNQVWLGTDLGIILYRNVVFNDPFKNITQQYIQGIKKGRNNNMFFSDGSTVYEVDNNLNATAFFTPKEGLIISLETDSSGVWMGTNDGKLIYKKYNGKIITRDFSKVGNGIYSIAIDREFNTWIIQARPEKETLLKIDSKGVITDFTPPFGQNERVRALKLSPNKEVFVCATGNDQYLYKYNYQNKEIDNISLPINPSFNIIMSVSDIAFTDSGTLLLATKFGVWDYNNKGIKKVDLGDMSNEMVSAIAIDKDKRVWFANSNGIIRYENGLVTVYNNTDGLPAKTTNYRCLDIDALDNLWVGTISGLAVGKIQMDKKKSDLPQISMLEKSGMIYDMHEKPSFIENTLLSFSLASAMYPSKYVEYKYSLSKNEKTGDWIYLPAYKDNILLNNLKQGKYELKIQAKNKGHFDWSDPLVYKFAIYKKWYNRAEILFGIYLLIFILIWLYIRIRINRNDKIRKKLEGIIKSRTQNLSEQNNELKELNTNLKIAKEEAEAAIKSKDRFFSILAHDLKSPFNILIGFSQLLVHNRKAISEESMQDLFGEMLKISENTYNLLQNLLDWAMSQTGALKIEKKSLVFDDLLKDLLPTLEDFAKQKEIQIILDVQESLIVFADEALIGTVFRNLISNAIKFSHKKSSIHITGIEKDGVTQISVMDSGIGISKEKLSKLFAIDENVSSPGTSNEMGTGLGLILCHEFIEKSNGSIKVTSKLGKGTTFVIQLPQK